MNLLKIIFLINCLLILINTECTPDDDSLLKLDKIRKFDDCDKRVTKAELLENDAYKCCYLHYEADTRNVEADIHTCCLVTQSQYDNIKDTIKIAYLELAIYYYYDIFVKYCEKVVEKIVSHLYTFDKADDILIPDKLHPIVFPNPSNFIQILDGNIDKSDESSEPVLLYSIWGVNYTLTWHNLTYKFGQTLGSSGNWKPIKHQFQQKNYFQDLLIN